MVGCVANISRNWVKYFKFSSEVEAYSKPCETSKMKCFPKTVNGL